MRTSPVVVVIVAIVAALSLSSCEHALDSEAPLVGVEPLDIAPLSFEERVAVGEVIKAVALAKGLTNAVVLAGVANHETNLVHCFGDAPFHCAGPGSQSCGGAVLAGSGDGPCHIQQGGLGMYQLDSGTYWQTLAAHGDDVLELDGNIDSGIEIIIEKIRICHNTPQFQSREHILEWINSALPGTDRFDTYNDAMASCYNGCSVAVCGQSLHDTRQRQYRDATLRLLAEMSEGFWQAAPPPPPDPATLSCGDYSSAMGYVDGACEWNGNGACGAQGPATIDCDACCDRAALPFVAPDPSTLSCGDYAAAVQFTNAQCEWNGNGACGGRGARTNDCDACCDR